MEFAQICDLVEAGVFTPGPIDHSALAGKWINANPSTTGIAQLEIAAAAEQLSLRAYAIGPDGLIDWGQVDMTVFTATPASHTGAGFICNFDFGFAEARIEGMIMKGLLVLAQFHTFKDQSGRAPYFVREYFALAHGRY